MTGDRYSFMSPILNWVTSVPKTAPVIPLSKCRLTRLGAVTPTSPLYEQYLLAFGMAEIWRFLMILATFFSFIAIPRDLSSMVTLGLPYFR